MSYGDYFTLMGVGGAFIIIGLVGLLWGRHEEKSYFRAMADRSDLREFVSHWPERPQLKALKIGGWIAIAVGLPILVTGIIRWLLAGPLA
jgi:hypothetical protein